MENCHEQMSVNAVETSSRKYQELLHDLEKNKVDIVLNVLNKSCFSLEGQEGTFITT